MYPILAVEKYVPVPLPIKGCISLWTNLFTGAGLARQGSRSGFEWHRMLVGQKHRELQPDPAHKYRYWTLACEH